MPNVSLTFARTSRYDRIQQSALRVRLDAPLPEEVATGNGTAIFVCGWCFSPHGRIRSLRFVVGDTRQPVLAHGMPRLDLFRELHPGLDPYAAAADKLTHDPSSQDDPGLLSYRSGFWGIVRLTPPKTDGEVCTLALEAELSDGAVANAVVASLRLRRVPSRPSPVARATPARGDANGSRTAANGSRTAAGPRVAICMATYNPPLDLVTRQLDSIRAQTHANWVCAISDDGSSAAAFAALRAAVGDDPRFVVSRTPRRLGFYHNFERALAMVDDDVDFVALADQDDHWDPDKLEVLLDQIGDAPLIYSDMRIVARDGAALASSYWVTRRNNHTDLLSLLVANAVTGAASMLRRDLLDDALPFPPGQFSHYHDHWLALVALSLGEIRYVDRPLYNYVQHAAASLGHDKANQMPSLAHRLRGLRTRDPRERIRKWRMHYFVDIARLMQFATVLDMRCRGRMTAEGRRALRVVLDSDRSLPHSVRLLRRGARELVGRPETLGAEWMLFCALIWRRLLSASARDLPQRHLRLDALPPSTLAPSTLAPTLKQAGAGLGAAVSSVSEKIAPLNLEVSDEVPIRINLLVPTIDLDHFFGGYIAKFNLAASLARRGHRVRIVTVDPVGPLPRDWTRRLESYSGLARLTEQVEVSFGRASSCIEVSPDDRFIATTWWTAHIARSAHDVLGGGRFLYLIQEYEPFTFPMGTYAALARDSYTFAHCALFSTEPLRGYFRAHSIGVYAAGTDEGDLASTAFDNAITAVPTPTVASLAARGTPRLLFYARPEQHAARNLFELGVLALDRAAQNGCFVDGWELRGIGLVEGERRLALADGRPVELLQRAGQDDYANLLLEHDVGLALMYTPHPSLVPLEMASAAMLTVTNSFENKTADVLTEISSNLIAAEPSVDAIAAALARAVDGVGNYEARIAGSHMRWPRSWEQSFDRRVLEFVERALGQAG